MQEQKEMNVDIYIREKVQSLSLQPGFGINPSRDFADRVMKNVMTIEKKRRFARITIYSVLALVPFVIRAAWVVARHDYVSVSHLPFADFVLKVYGVFMEPWTPYLFLGLGIATVAYLIRYRPHTFYSVRGSRASS